MTKDRNTEKKIIEAAKQVFEEEGYAGARMQQIADSAQINKGLLHYYFKSKDKIFETVFTAAFEKMMSKVGKIFQAELPIEEKIEMFVNQYLDVLSKNSYVPAFVLSELNKRPQTIVDKILNHPNKPKVNLFAQQIQTAVDEGKIRPIKPEHLIINLVSMCIFPFVGKPMIQILLEKDKTQYNKLLKERKTEVTQFILQAIKP
jgi:TetR/AcrR family transcriptional regulator